MERSSGTLAGPMSYLVLARKFRPQTFESIVGQEHITKALANAIVRGRIPHALLLTGPRGVGKTSAARVFARAVNCNGRPVPPAGGNESDTRKLVEPCGECANCKEIARSASLAVWEIDGASNNSVDNVRELIESLRSLPPPGSAYKIYIIDEVHMLSTSAFNALLKSLEEPPPNTLFIFATTEPHKIPETVISRCQRHDFHRLSATTIVEQLRKIAEAEKVEVDTSVLRFIALKAQGGMRDAQSMFDRLLAFSQQGLTLELAQKVFGYIDRGFFLDLSQKIAGGDVPGSLLLLNEVFSQSVDVRSFAADFISHFRNLLIVGFCRGGTGKGQEQQVLATLELEPEEQKKLLEVVSSVDQFQLQRLFEAAEETTQQALISPFPRYVYEAGVAKMATLPDLRPLAELITELRRGGSSAGSSSTGGGPGGSGFSGGVRPQKRPAPGAPSLGAAAPGSQSPGARATAPALKPVASAGPSEPPPFDLPPDYDPFASASGSLAPAGGAKDASSRQSRNAGSGSVKAQASSSERDSEATSDLSGVDEASAADFNPNWVEFISFARTRGGMALATYLKRVAPRVFIGGRLEIEGTDFELSALRDLAMTQSLRDSLSAYSGLQNWNISFVAHGTDTTGARAGEQKGAPPKAAGARPATPPSRGGFVPGSIAEKEAKDVQDQKVEMIRQARTAPSVQAVLDVFSGSKIERINEIK